jgi:serine/threonine-protein kinase RsbW
MGFDIESIEDIKVAVGEACNNVVLHGACESDFKISFIIENSEFVVEVNDSGNGFRVDNYNEPDLLNPGENGLGIFIMKSLMDDVTVNSELGQGTMIRMIKRLVV